jgi:transcriptional regulator with XRE-family HTH domain
MRHRIEKRREERTFEQIVLEDYGGNLTDACQDAGVSSENMYNYLNGTIDSRFVKNTLRSIAAFFGEPVDILFPTHMYRQRAFVRIYDAPGYRVLAEKLGLEYQNGFGKPYTLFHAVLERGLSASEYHRLCSAFTGALRVTRDSDFGLKISSTFDVDFDELFPSAHYPETDEYRIPFTERTISTEEHREARRALRQSVVPDTRADLRAAADKILSVLNGFPREQNIVRLHCGFNSEGRVSISEIARRQGVKKQGISDIYLRAQQRVRDTLSEDELEEMSALLRTYEAQDRVKT